MPTLLGKSFYSRQYYYCKLNSDRKSIYETIYSELQSFSATIKLPNMPTNEVFMIFESVLLDNPLIFYVSTVHYSRDLYKKCCILKPEYQYAKSFVKQKTKEIIKYLRTFDSLSQISDIDKEIYIHDFCLNNFRYDDSFSNSSNSILGAIFEKVAVCGGISKFVKLTFDYLGIKSLVVIGKGTNPQYSTALTETHAWNIVKIDGNFYHLDVTYDLTLKDKRNRYKHFNLPDSDIKKDHIIITDVPACTTRWNAIVR